LTVKNSRKSPTPVPGAAKDHTFRKPAGNEGVRQAALNPATISSLETEMNKDQIKGKAKDIAGKVQQKTGQITGSASQQAKGAAKQVEGKIQKGVGDANEALKDANRKTRP